jgi:sortase A
MRRSVYLERSCWALGILLLAVYVGIRLHGTLGSRADLDRFYEAAEQLRQTSVPAEKVKRALTNDVAVDFSLWSKARVEHYRDSLRRDVGLPLAVLRVPRIGLEVPVLEGTDEIALNRGVGRIVGTASPGEVGNLGIAGHRDGFFRGLKDIALGDSIELLTLEEVATYVIDELLIVEPDDTRVLDPSDESILTLVTCYPFYYVGDAPQRFIVRASLQREIDDGDRASLR